MDGGWDKFGVPDDHPGPIDNSSLFNGAYFNCYYLMLVHMHKLHDSDNDNVTLFVLHTKE
jgi:hypothetical protein